MPIDYARMQRTHRIHKAALTRAVKTGDRDKVLTACRKAVAEWDAIGAWPDDWSTWQVAIDDTFGWPGGPRLEELR
jgi:hypothetical protein